MKATNTLGEVLICTFLIVVTVGIGTTVFRSGPKDLRASTTRNLGKVGQACNLYAVDHGGRYPMSMSYNSINKVWRTNSMIRTPAGWAVGTSSVEPRRTEEAQAWSNALFAYGMNRTSYQVAGGLSFFNLGTAGKTAEPALIGINMNGLAHTFDQASVQSPSSFPAFWTGMGANNVIGGAIHNPSLNCPTANLPCLYRPKQWPQNSHSGAFFFFVQCGTSGARQSSRVHGLDALYVTQDGSVGAWPMGLVSKPEATDRSNDPFSQYDPGGVCPGGYHWDGWYPWLFRPDYVP